MLDTQSQLTETIVKLDRIIGTIKRKQRRSVYDERIKNEIYNRNMVIADELAKQAIALRKQIEELSTTQKSLKKPIK